jgi:AhpD family alkylhydroperoxidase
MQTKRINISEVTPGAYQGLIQLDIQIAQSGLSKTFIHLIKVRASLINGCAYCIRAHTKDALAEGETAQRLLSLDAWEESPDFTNEEKAILALTDEATLISNRGVSDAVFENAVKVLGKENVAHAIMAIACINAWNRIGRATLLIPE